MKWLLDLGNSCCKSAMLAGGKITCHEPRLYNKENRLAVIESILREQTTLPRQAIICSVLDESFNRELTQWLGSHKLNDCYFLNPCTETFGIRLGYANPAQLGADRLAVMIAVHEKFDGDKCIVDYGTAVTIDVLDANGIHRGGVILPGAASMQRALCADTGIAHYEAGGKFDIFAANTLDAAHTGCLIAVTGGIQQAVDTMQAHYGSLDRVIVTGGHAAKVVAYLHAREVVQEPQLVLDSLAIVARRMGN